MKKKKNVPLAKENKAAEEVKPDSSLVPKQPQNDPVNDSLFSLDQIPKKQLETAEALGIPLTAIFTRMNLWSASVEARIQLLTEGINDNPERTIKLLQAEAIKQREAMQAQRNTQPQTREEPEAAQSQHNQLLQIVGVAKQAGLIGGPTEDPFTAAIKEGMIKNAVESMNSDAQMGRAIKEHVISSLAQKVAKGITETVIL